MEYETDHSMVKIGCRPSRNSHRRREAGRGGATGSRRLGGGQGEVVVLRLLHLGGVRCFRLRVGDRGTRQDRRVHSAAPQPPLTVAVAQQMQVRGAGEGRRWWCRTRS